MAMFLKTTRYFHATYLYQVAVRASKSTFSDKSGPIVSILFSATALEAFINESAELASSVPTDHEQKLVKAYASIMGELSEKKEALLVKYHMGLLVFAGEAWDEGAQPFQDFKTLVALRNALVHMKGDKWETDLHLPGSSNERKREQFPKFIQALQDRGVVRRTRNSAPWLELVNTIDVAAWACRTAALVTKQFYQVVPDGFFKGMLSDHVLRDEG